MIFTDIYAIVKGSYKDHARLGARMSRKILAYSKDFTLSEIEIITEAIAHHSDKHIYTDMPYIELAKDADVFDCSLYPGAKGFYELHKPKEIYHEYVERIKKVRQELGLPSKKIFRD